jgi:hypothetical protein
MNPRQHPSASLSLRLSPSEPISPSESDSEADPDPESGRDICPEALRSLHSAALRAAAQELAPLEGFDQSLLDGFMARFTIASGDACWVWTGSLQKKNYGVFRGQRAHRLAYQLFRGPIPEGHGVLHTCDNPPCVRPSHLFTGTKQDNVDDMVKKNRQASGNRHGARTHPERIHRGDDHLGSKLTEQDVIDLRLSTLSNRELADIYDLDITTIRKARSGESWRHVVI